MKNGSKKKEIKVSSKKMCHECSRELVLNKFFKSNNPNHKFGVMNICKDCSTPVDIDNIEDVKRKLYGLDRPFISEIWEKSKEETIRRGYSGSSMFGIYLKNLQMKNGKYEFSTWADTEMESTDNIEIDEIIPHRSSKLKIVITDELIDKWGAGYSDEEYVQFEKKYKRLINNYGEKTALHTEGLITYIRYRVKEEMATASGSVKDAKEWGTLASKAAQDAKINVSQLSKSDISGGVDVLSQLFEAVESEVGIIPLLPHILEQPYDDADMIIWATINYNRRLEDKTPVSYRDVWNFYDQMLEEHFTQQNFNNKQINEFKAKRNNIFRDLEQVYKEPLYESEGE